MSTASLRGQSKRVLSADRYVEYYPHGCWCGAVTNTIRINFEKGLPVSDLLVGGIVVFGLIYMIALIGLLLTA